MDGKVQAPGSPATIPAVPELVKLLDVANKLVTADARCTRSTRRRRRCWRRAATTCWRRGQQEELRDDVALYLDESPAGAEIESHEEVGTDHGRVEVRTASVCHDVEWLRGRHPDWSGMAAIGKVEAVRMPTGGKRTVETPLQARRGIGLSRR